MKKNIDFFTHLQEKLPLQEKKSFIQCLQRCKCMAQGKGRGLCLESNVKFFWKRFLYVIILLQIYKKISIHSYHFFKPLFLFFQISARRSLKKFKNEKWLKARYLSLYYVRELWELEKVQYRNFENSKYGKSAKF